MSLNTLKPIMEDSNADITVIYIFKLFMNNHMILKNLN